MGHGEPIDLGAAPVSADGDKTVTREGFNALTPSARLAFVKAGGKIK